MGENKKLDKLKQKGLNPKQKKAIELLVFQGLSQSEVVKAVQVKKSTLSTWINHNETFKKEYDKQIDIASELAMKKFKMGLSQAIDTILDLSKNAESESVRLSASKEIKDYANKNTSISHKLDKEKLVTEKLRNQLLEKELNPNNEELELKQNSHLINLAELINNPEENRRLEDD